MARQNSQNIIVDILQQEMGDRWGDVVKDPSGEISRFGIPQSELQNDVRKIDVEDAVTYYKNEYWDLLHGDEIQSPRIAASLFRIARQIGVTATISLVQNTLDIDPADGLMGPQTLRILNTADEVDFDSRFEKQAETYLAQFNSKKGSAHLESEEILKNASTQADDFSSEPQHAEEPIENQSFVDEDTPEKDAAVIFSKIVRQVDKTHTSEDEKSAFIDKLNSCSQQILSDEDNAATIASESLKQLTEDIHNLHTSEDEKQLLNQNIKEWLGYFIKEKPNTTVQSAIEIEAITKESNSDYWTIDDQLGYEKYAHALAKLILDGRAQPPLSISVQAPWGQGKTSLMRMIKYKLENGLDADANEEKNDTQSNTVENNKFKTSGIQTKLQNILSWTGEISEQIKPMLKVNEDTIPCIWFNPLYYQNSDQVWSGLAHTLLHQLTEKLPSTLERERFWFRLRLSRLNKPAIRRDIHKLILERILPKGLIWTGILILMLSSMLFKDTALGLFLIENWGLNFVPVIAGLIHFLTTIDKDLSLDDKLAKYISEPDYNNKLGLLHLVDADIDRALQLMVGKEGKLVIFIDDLDRCEPQAVNNIMLAINLFISVRDRNIIFILGMDTHMVAMSIETAADKQAETYNKNRHSSKGYGWRFMEKFIQLPFFIPRIKEERAKQYLNKLLLLEQTVKTPTAERNKIQKLIKAADNMQQINAVMKNIPGIDPKTKSELEKSIAEKVIDLTTKDHSETLQKLVNAAIEDLHYNPRDMKRFLNVARLLFLNFENEENAGSHEHMLKVVRASHLILNWPQCLRWLQGNAHSFNIHGEKQDPVLSLSTITQQTGEHDYGIWCKAVEQEWGKTIANTIAQPDFFAYLHRIEHQPPGLQEIFESNIF